MTEMMLAAVASEHGPLVQQVQRPRPAPGEVLVKIEAAGLNRADLNAARGNVGTPLGMEWAGIVKVIGGEVTTIAVGDRVACSGTGGYAEYAVADAGRTLPIGDVDPLVAASLPLALMTAHNALVTAGRFVPGQDVLIHGASSGVGIAAIKIAKLLGARRVIGTSSSADKRARLEELGADLMIDPSPGWSRAVMGATGGVGVQVVVDMVTGAGVNETMRAAALEANIVNVGRLGGAFAEFDLDFHALRRLNFVGVTFRTRTAEEIRAIAAAMRQNLWTFVENERLSLPVDRTFRLADVAGAHEYMAGNKHFGKILLRP